MEKLYEKAKIVMKNSYSPYSLFKVGAALELDDGKIITGANIENASFGLSNCAERTALFYAYSQGYTKNNIKRILVTTEQDHIVSPCGACRQVMKELLTPDCEVILVDNLGNTQKLLNKDLLPYGFGKEDM